MKKELIARIKLRKATIGIIGLGYVGLPLVIRFGEEGFKVIGFDLDQKKISKLNRGLSYIKHVSAVKIKKLVAAKRFSATSNYSLLRKADCILICVPTPLNENREPDMSYIEKSSCALAQNLRKGQLVSLESTTYPGTTREVLLPKFAKNGLRVGKDFFLVYSPEREDPGNPKHHTKVIPKVVGGITKNCTQIGKLMYDQVVTRTVTVSSTEEAEFTKLFENIFRSVNIALVNELKMLTDRMGINIWQIIEASATKPFGFMPFYPGPGLGGHCIPIDPFYLSWKAKEYGFHTKFIELAGDINTNIPDYVVTKTIDALNKQKRCVKDSRVMILGVAYKKDVDDIRESPALEIMKLLREKGAKIFYNDPYIAQIKKTRKYSYNLRTIALVKKNLNKMDAVIIVTDHSCYDYQRIVNNARLVIDTRNATKTVKRNRSRIIMA